MERKFFLLLMGDENDRQALKNKLKLGQDDYYEATTVQGAKLALEETSKFPRKRPRVTFKLIAFMKGELQEDSYQETTQEDLTALLAKQGRVIDLGNANTHKWIENNEELIKSL
jgi:hypothetical protein